MNYIGRLRLRLILIINTRVMFTQERTFLLLRRGGRREPINCSSLFYFPIFWSKGLCEIGLGHLSGAKERCATFRVLLGTIIHIVINDHARHERNVMLLACNGAESQINVVNLEQPHVGTSATRWHGGCFRTIIDDPLNSASFGVSVQIRRSE